MNESHCKSYTEITAQTCVSAATKSPDSLILAYRGTDSVPLVTYLWLSFIATHFGKLWGCIAVLFVSNFVQTDLCAEPFVDELQIHKRFRHMRFPTYDTLGKGGSLQCG